MVSIAVNHLREYSRHQSTPRKQEVRNHDALAFSFCEGWSHFQEPMLGEIHMIPEGISLRSGATLVLLFSHPPRYYSL